MWQCSDSGSVPGINGDVDLDFWFGTPRTINNTDTSTDSEPVKVNGDINDDGVSDKDDVNMILDYVTGKIELTSTQISVGDLNGDGVVNVADALMYY
jgi:hypothetical protein